MIDDAFQSRRDPIVAPGANMELAMQLIMASVLQDLVGTDRKPPSPRPSPAQAGGEGERTATSHHRVAHLFFFVSLSTILTFAASPLVERAR
jgi:hypothetical protein